MTRTGSSMVRKTRVVLLMIATYICAPHVTRCDERPVAVTCKLDPSGSSRLHCSAKNESRDTVTVPFAALPWKTPHALRLWVFALEEPARELQGLGVIADAFGLQTTLKPGAMAEGEIDLDALVPDLPAARRRSDVCIVWLYAWPGAPPNALNAAAGVLRRSARP